MSGNYDHPPATRRPSRGSGPSDRPQRPNVARLQHLRDLLTSERNRNSASTARALDALNQEISEYRSSDYSGDRPNFEQAREAVDRQIQQLQSDLAGRQERIRSIFLGYDRPGQVPTTVNPSAMNQGPDQSNRPSRRRGQGRPPRPSRPLRRDTPVSTNPLDPSSRGDTPTIMPQDVESGRPVRRRRSKRRKLDSDDNREGSRGFGYGHRGQVVPAMLRMQLVSCDGGNYESGSGYSFPENILKNDPSVYCTKSDRCNLVLQHPGEIPFCVNRIVIKAPKTGYDAPIQEGLVFVSMASDEIFARTKEHRVQYASTYRRRRTRRNLMQPSQEYLNSVRSPLQSLERTTLTNPDSRSDSGNDMASSTGQSGTSALNPTRVITDYDDNSEEGTYDDQENDDDLPSVAEIERLHMEQMEDDFLCTDSDSSESDDDSTELSMFNHRRRLLLRHIRNLEQEAERERVRSDGPMSYTRVRYYPEFDGPNSELLKPNARFYIERSKSKVTIKFDPPLSGRYILVKLWSPASGANIDIQSIIAHGFVGPRFFPAGNFR